MRSSIAFIIVIFFNFSSLAKDVPNCSEDEIYTGKLFQLNIKHSFRGSYEYKFCVGDESSFLISKYTEHLPQNLPDLLYTSKVKLTVDVSEKLKSIYQKTLITLPKESSRGKDGPTWCFKPKSGTSYSVFCYWSAEYESSNRGLNNLHKLKLFIHDLSGIDGRANENST